jgi:2-methylcitrate dehydratase PrpD
VSQAESATARLAAFVSAPPVAPEPVRAAGVRSVLDTLGVLLAGLAEPVVRSVADTLGREPGPAALVGRGRRVAAPAAALVNGVAAHAIDYDDVHSHVRGHPSACVLPAALAAAEHAGRSGAGLLEAYLVGIETAARVGRAVGPSHAAAGFHSTATLGVLGAAAAAARALGLDAAGTEHALGIAASSAGGLRRNFGTMTKPLHAGFAARDGVTAALLAQAGVTAAPDAVDSFVAAFCPAGDGDLAALGRPGQPWEILDPGLAIKKYPCCNRGHRAVDAVLALVAEHDLTPDRVAAVAVRMPAGQVDAAGRVGPMTYPVPRTGLQAKFSMPYVVAAAITHRGLPMAAFTDPAVHDPGVTALAAKVRPVNRPDPADLVQVVVSDVDGGRFDREVRFTRGDPRGGEPLSFADVLAKYVDCAGTVLDPAAVDRSAALIRDLESLPAAGDLTKALEVR